MLEIFVFIVKFIFGAILFFAIYELIREIKRKRNLEKYKQIKNFSDYCKLEVHSYADVINRRELKEFIFSKLKSQPNVLTTENIDDIYIKLLPYTQVSDEFKEQHIKNIEKTRTKISGKLGLESTNNY